MCSAIFIGGGYLYLENSFTDADNDAEKIPFYIQNPDNAGVLVSAGEEQIFFYLDFSSQKLYAATKFDAKYIEEKLGYSIDYTIDGKEGFIEKVLDSFEGVVLENNGEKLRYTGYQTARMLDETVSDELRKEIVKSICDKVKKDGIEKSFYYTIVDNSKNNLKISECYFWYEKLPSLCENLIFID